MLCESQDGERIRAVDYSVLYKTEMWARDAITS